MPNQATNNQTDYVTIVSSIAAAVIIGLTVAITLFFKGRQEKNKPELPDGIEL
jgi:hypothetical protein